MCHKDMSHQLFGRPIILFVVPSIKRLRTQNYKLLIEQEGDVTFFGLISVLDKTIWRILSS